MHINEQQSYGQLGHVFVVLQTSQIGVHAHHMAPAILRYLIYPLAIFNEVIMYIVNAVLL